MKTSCCSIGTGAAPNDPYYDLATIAVFLRMDDESCRALIAAHDGAVIDQIPARFDYWRRFVGVVCGTLFLRLSRESGYAGAGAGETLASAPSLGDLYQRLRAGTLSPATGEGQWCFGLALLRASTEI